MFDTITPTADLEQHLLEEIKTRLSEILDEKFDPEPPICKLYGWQLLKRAGGDCLLAEAVRNHPAKGDCGPAPGYFIKTSRLRLFRPELRVAASRHTVYALMDGPPPPL